MNAETVFSRLGLSLTSERHPGGRPGWPRGSSHWFCTVRRRIDGRRRQWTTTAYSMGSALTGPPELADVLASLILDADTTDGRDFSEWCDDLGYSDDSISAREMFRACEKTAERLAGFFSEEELSELREALDGR